MYDDDFCFIKFVNFFKQDNIYHLLRTILPFSLASDLKMLEGEIKWTFHSVRNKSKEILY